MATLAHGPATDARPSMQPAPLCLLCPLAPQANECRSILDLSGLWDFQADPEDVGVAQEW
jgi:hypothetical protein